MSHTYTSNTLGATLIRFNQQQLTKGEGYGADASCDDGCDGISYFTNEDGEEVEFSIGEGVLEEPITALVCDYIQMSFNL